MLKKFNEAHPNIKVFYTADPENLEEQMAADMLAGTAPDVLAGCCEFFPAWANAGYLMDLRTWMQSDLEAMLQLTVHEGNRTTQWGSMFDVAWERIQIHVNGWGGNFVNRENPKECMMSEPAAIEAMEWLRARIWDDHVMATYLDVQTNSTRQAFIDQKVAMVEDGSWSLKDILDSATFRVGVAPFPAGPERRVTLATTDGFGIYSHTKHQEAAWQLLNSW